LYADSNLLIEGLAIQHTTRNLDNERSRIFMEKLNESLKPHIADKGYDWGYTIENTSRDLWKMQGLVPSYTDTEAAWESL
jgi:hypothetical protein